jgi:RimJ/RimL family protein N-acetyltransferase
MRCERLYDSDLITRCMTHEKVWPWVTDDSCPPREEFTAPIEDHLIYLGVYEGSEFLGLFFLHQQNGICWEVHTCLLPVAWGRSERCTAECADWMFSNTDCRRIVTNVPANNPLALRLALRSGMKEYGRNPQSIMKGGVLLDQVLLGMSKGE